MGLLKFLVRRVISIIPVLIGVLVLTFIISRAIVPDPARVWAGPRADQATLRSIAEEYHMYDPLYIQFWYYVRDLAQGNWGLSPSSGQPVLMLIVTYFPATLELSIVAMAIAIGLGILVGVAGAVKHNTWPDGLSRLLTMFGVATPPFLIALIIQLVFFYYLGVFPDSGGRISVFVNDPLHITGMFILDSLITGNWPAFWSSLQHIIMPAFSLAFIYFGIFSRITRAAMLEVLGMDYIRTARSKGLIERVVIFKHALRNALIPTTTVVTVMFAYMLGGSIVVESIFDWPGIGRYAAQSIVELDFPAVMGVTLIFAICVVIANLLADILYTLLDPRIVV
ncbi:MAG: ABC transporter permease [Candidatus Bathyarchaeia archaeon]